MMARRSPGSAAVRRRRLVMAALAAAGAVASLGFAVATPATATLDPGGLTTTTTTTTTTTAPPSSTPVPEAAAPDAVGLPDSRGTDFWLTFPRNYFDTPELTLFITAGVATSGTVEVTALEFAQPFDVVPGTVTSVVLPPTAQVSSNDVVEANGIHVTSQEEVTVYGLSRIQYPTDAYLGLPTDILGTDHLVMSYPDGSSEFALVAPSDDTTVTITPSVIAFGHDAGVPFQVTLDRGQTYQLDAGQADLTGTQVSSTKPIGVYGANGCANIPNGYSACDHIVEQLPPTSAWGKQFLTEPLATRVGGDTFRVLASADGTAVSVDGAVVATLDRGQVHEQIIAASSTISATQPVLVASSRTPRPSTA
ncbi:MAG: IgGFc-binding protein [Acidimicrobiales bacterium]